MGEPLRLVHRHPQEITVAEANRLMHRDKNDVEGLEQLLAVAELSLSWRRTLERHLLGRMDSTRERVRGLTKKPA